jgi:transposase
MDRAYLRTAKARLVEAMDRGLAWDEAAVSAGLLISRATAYRLWLRACCEGATAFDDHRHGHPSKTCPLIRTWLLAQCQDTPHIPTHELQLLIQQQFGMSISVRQLNRVRAALGVRTVRPPTPKKT